jgi:hypothetical protein
MGVPPLCLIRTKNINEKQRKTLVTNCENSPTINLLFHKFNNNTLFKCLGRTILPLVIIILIILFIE